MRPARVGVAFADDADGEDDGGEGEEVFGSEQRVDCGDEDGREGDGDAEEQAEAVERLVAHAHDHLVELAEGEDGDEGDEDNAAGGLEKIHRREDDEPEGDGAENAFGHDGEGSSTSNVQHPTLNIQCGDDGVGAEFCGHENHGVFNGRRV
jgi:hypothetical protein